jgi:hypothetical protein
MQRLPLGTAHIVTYPATPDSERCRNRFEGQYGSSMDTIKVHRHYILRDVTAKAGSRTGPLYRQIAVLESSSSFHLQFLVKRWRCDEVQNYFTTAAEIEDMTFAMHPTLSSAIADVELEVEHARRSGEWEIRQGD